MKRIMSDLMDWKLQSHDIKTLVLTGSTEEDRTDVVKSFSKEFFDHMIHINIKNNPKIHDYICTHPTGRDTYVFIETEVLDMVIPMETVLIFNNMDSCPMEVVKEYATSFFEPEDESFLIIAGDFKEEDFADISDRIMFLELPPKEA